ncbi:MAG: hypothetical protein ACK6D4_09740, partial [Planctomyces sp.]
RVNKVVEPLDGTKADGQIVVDIMNRMGHTQPAYDPDTVLKESDALIVAGKDDDLAKAAAIE